MKENEVSMEDLEVDEEILDDLLEDAGEPTFFEKVRKSKWVGRVGWGLLAVTVATVGAVLLAGNSDDDEEEGDEVDLIGGTISDEDSEDSEENQES